MKDSRRNLFTLRAFLREYLNLQKGRENQSEVVEYISDSIEYKGSQLWILIFAILIASLGLNVNSIYAIVGAMLIAPMMGPIMGVGMSLGMNDFDLMKRSLKSYLITTLFCVGTSTIYFLISPITVAPSDFIFQTSPTIYNVMIALFGGLAGFIALSTSKKGTVLVGVAIVTALIPPLCTAGYGLSSGNFVIFLGALYLYFIDSICICFATFLGVRMLHYPKKEFVNKKQEWKVRKYMFLVVILSLIPTLYLTVGIIRTAIFNARANRFVTEQFNFKGSSVLYNKCSYNRDGRKVIQVVIVGKELPSTSIEQVRAKLPEYKLEQTELDVMQGTNSADLKNNPPMRDMMMGHRGDLPMAPEQANRSAELELNKFQQNDQLSAELLSESKLLFPQVGSISVGNMLQSTTNPKQNDTLSMAMVHLDKKMSEKEKNKLSEWIQTRMKAKKNFSLIEK